MRQVTPTRRKGIRDALFPVDKLIVQVIRFPEDVHAKLVTSDFFLDRVDKLQHLTRNVGQVALVVQRLLDEAVLRALRIGTWPPQVRNLDGTSAMTAECLLDEWSFHSGWTTVGDGVKTVKGVRLA